MAAVLTAHVALLAFRVLRQFSDPRLLLVRPALALVGLDRVQLCLGAGTWLTHYGPPAWLRAGWLANNRWLAGYTVEAGSLWQTHVTTAHVAAGSLILGTSLAWRCGRCGCCIVPFSRAVERKLAEVAA